MYRDISMSMILETVVIDEISQEKNWNGTLNKYHL